MFCPNPACAAMNPRPALTLADRQGIEIDYCPHCRGVWLDRGELDKLIERASAQAEAAQPRAAADVSRHEQPRHEQPRYEPHRHDKPHYQKPHYDSYYGGKRKKSLLSELFDFD